MILLHVCTVNMKLEIEEHVSNPEALEQMLFWTEADLLVALKYLCQGKPRLLDRFILGTASHLGVKFILIFLFNSQQDVE